MLTHFLQYLILLPGSGEICPQLLFKMPYLETGNRILLGIRVQYMVSLSATGIASHTLQHQSRHYTEYFSPPHQLTTAVSVAQSRTRGPVTVICGFVQGVSRDGLVASTDALYISSQECDLIPRLDADGIYVR